jgi:arylsulfatase A-like enzyme
VLAASAGLAWLGTRLRVPPPDSLEPHAGPILLISLDNVRADRLGCYGFERPTSPNLDRLAARSLVYEDVISSSNWTLPAHVSLFTGRRPRGHGVIHHGFQLDPEIPTLTEHLREVGYRSTAFVTHANVSRLHGLDVGFDEWHDLWLEPRQAPPADPPASEVCAQVLSFLVQELRDDPQRRLFVFLHLFTAHWPFEPEPDLAKLFDPDYNGPVVGDAAWVTRFLAENHSPADERGFEHLSRLYDAELATLDRALGVLFDGLEEAGLLAPLSVFVTSDHGEAFKEHGVFTHGFSTYQEELRIPLLVKLAETFGPRHERRVSTPVSLVDVAPTILKIAQAEPLLQIDGKTLLTDHGSRGRTLLAESSLDHLFMDFERVAMRLGPIKYMFAPAVRWYGAEYGERAFDLTVDPQERHDLLEEQPALRDECRRWLQHFDYQVLPGVTLLWGAGMAEDWVVEIEVDAPLERLFRARTATRPVAEAPAPLSLDLGGNAWPEQADIDSIQRDRRDGGGELIRLSGIARDRPCGIVLRSSAPDATVTVRWLGGPSVPIRLVGSGGDPQIHSTSSPLSFRAVELGPLADHEDPPAGEIWVGTMSMLEFDGERVGLPAAELTPEVREQLEAFGYAVPD